MSSLDFISHHFTILLANVQNSSHFIQAFELGRDSLDIATKSR